ncbi:recombinase family protein [Streptomyces sp. NBC_00620]|uniref:recombinase family protein n=1 Tax=Streptomyces sp. NBC_00620 TaxID=2903666 RepID=UPI002258DB99|nr:recombinase family protein [Streptomyces sp. NBC_00620]MCX4978537.1 recombinase family protein [Streptomyces sp. NBC_00620]
MTTRFAFAGRVSTEDQQDPETSRNWQILRAESLIATHGVIVQEFFDIGHSRSIPWPRRPRAAALLQALKDPDRGFEAVVIGEPQRAFYGNQFGLTFPVFAHYGVQLWVPEAGGPIDPESEAHDLVMSVFGGMSKGERNRIKIRVRSAMAAQAKIEGRFLGGRPPYGYRLVDAGPHPNPSKAADGRRLQRLEPDPIVTPVVQYIFREYLTGRGIFAIAESLTRADIPSPSAYDPDRNPHRCGVAWSKGAVRSILSNPRYTGRQVWSKQRKEEILIDVENVALGHETRMRWNRPETWVWSNEIVHTPLVSAEVFQEVQELRARKHGARSFRERRRTTHSYVFRGLPPLPLPQRIRAGQQDRPPPQGLPPRAGTPPTARPLALHGLRSSPARGNNRSHACRAIRQHPHSHQRGNGSRDRRQRRQAGPLPRSPGSRHRPEADRPLDRRGPSPPRRSTSPVAPGHQGPWDDEGRDPLHDQITRASPRGHRGR